MATAEERMRILKLIQDGRISAEEGAQLLEALNSPPTPSQTKSQGTAARFSSVPPISAIPNIPTPSGSTPGARWFRIVITDVNTGKTRVNVRMPVNLINAGMKMGARFSSNVPGLDSHTLMQTIQSGKMGKIVDVFDDEDDEHVEVFIE